MKKFALLSESNILIFTALSLMGGLLLWGWFRFPGHQIWGLYSSIDGQLAEWYGKALTEWSFPFVVSNINPFEGLGTLFFPNNTWFNIGALMLSVPVSREMTYVLSFMGYLVEVSISIYLLARVVFGLSRLEAIIAIEAFTFFLFPPFTMYTHAISFFSAAPFNAHLMTLMNFCLTLFFQLGKENTRLSDFAKVILCILLFFVALYSGPMTLLTYFPVYGILGLGIFIQDLKYSRRYLTTLFWKVSPVVLLLLILLMMDIDSYFSGTIKYVSRGYVATDFHLPLIQYLKGLVQAVQQYHPSDYPQASIFFIRRDYPICSFHLLAVCGALIGCFIKRVRWISLGFFVIGFSTDIGLIVNESQLFPNISLMNPYFYLWSSYSFYAVFFALFIGKFWQRVCLIWQVICSSLSVRTYDNKFLQLFIRDGFFLIFIFPIWGFCELTGDFFYKMPVVESVKTPIIEYLEKNIRLEPNSVFRGSVVSYLGASTGGIRPYLNDVRQDQMDNSIYIKSRDYLKQHYGNWHMFADLWMYGIPSLEEYGQWISKPLFFFTGKMLANPKVEFFTSNVNVFNLNYAVLRLLGVRFIITDSQLKHADIHRILTIEKNNVAPLYLYEIEKPNLGNYSPTHIVTLDSAQEIFDLLTKDNFDFEDKVMVQDSNMPLHLSKASNAQFRFDVNKIKVSAKSENISLLILPIQFSHCYKIVNKSKELHAKLFRANLVQMGILFRNDLNVELVFDFGMMRNASCRKKDVQDLYEMQLKKIKLNTDMETELNE